MLENIELRWIERYVEHQPAGESPTYKKERVLQYRTREAPREGAPYWAEGYSSGWVDVELGEET